MDIGILQSILGLTFKFGVFALANQLGGSLTHLKKNFFIKGDKIARIKCVLMALVVNITAPEQ